MGKVARQVCNKVPRKECRQVPVTNTVFKDETECYTVTERKCMKVSRTSCGVEDSKVAHTGVAVTSKVGGRVKAEPKSSETDYTVIMVGGGISGLSAARHLTANGITDIIILEARSRLGGRMFTRMKNGFNMEMGAQWIHEVKEGSNVLLDYANDKGLQLDESLFDGPIFGEGTVSAIRELKSDIEGNLDNSNDVVSLESRVTEINWNDDFVSVVYEMGSERKKITADHVICTLPLGVLKEKNVKIDHSLGREKERIIGKMDQGIRSKVLLHFTKPFWTESFMIGKEELIELSQEFNDWRSGIDDLFEVKIPNTLVMFIRGEKQVEEIQLIS